jgi:hypothetical protein
MDMLEHLLSTIGDAGVDELRRVWQANLTDPVPPVRAGDILRRALAERLQEEALGRDRDTERRLRSLSSRYKPGRKSRIQTASYQPGSLLVRVFEGVRHEVEVLPEGYRWRTRVYKSLSMIAREITGVRWNGPRFFGLREGKAR